MNSRERDMISDRQLRNAALSLVRTDMANVKQDLSARGIKDRVTGRMADGAVELFEEATELADNNRAVLATLLAAVGIWFARNPILAVLGLEDEGAGGGAAGANGGPAGDTENADQSAFPFENYYD